MSPSKRSTPGQSLRRARRALAGFTSPALAQRAQAIALSDAFDVRESLEIVRHQLYRRATRALAWAFVKGNFEAFAARLRSDDVVHYFVEPSGYFCAEAHRVELDAFYPSRVAKLDGVGHVATSAAEAIGQCAAAFEKNRAGLDAFLSRY